MKDIMKSIVRKHRAFTLLELVLVVAIIGILAALLLPALEQSRARSKQISCLSQLKQIGLAFHAFAHEHNNEFPFKAYTTNDSFLDAFKMVSNDLVTPKILHCPADRDRVEAANFGVLDYLNISYALSCGYAVFGDADSMVASDRNIQDTNSTSRIWFSGLHALSWSSEMHQYKGNILFGDGHVEKAGNERLAEATRRPGHGAIVQLPTSSQSGGGQSADSGRSGAGSANGIASRGSGSSGSGSGFSALQSFFDPGGTASSGNPSSGSGHSASIRPAGTIRSASPTPEAEAPVAPPIITNPTNSPPRKTPATNPVPVELAPSATSSEPGPTSELSAVAELAPAGPSRHWLLLAALLLLVSVLAGVMFERHRRHRAARTSREAD